MLHQLLKASVKVVFKSGPTPASFLFFRCFRHNFYRKTAVFSRIWTQIVKYKANMMTTRPPPRPEDLSDMVKKIHYRFQEVQHEQRPVSQVPLVDQYSSQQLSGQKDKFAKLPWVVEPSVCRKCTKFARIIAKRFGIQPRSIRHRPANVVRNDWLRDQQRRKFWRANQPARGCGHDHEESLRYAAKKVI